MLLSVLLFAAALSPVLAAPAPTPQGCTNPQKRPEWRELSAADQQSYIDAVLCLKTKPSRLGLDTSLYDDFPYVHSKLNMYIHNVAIFLPWHRLYGAAYHGALHECGYEGPQPYWDWTKDVRKLAASPVMSSTLGFGGDGSHNRTEVGPKGATLRCVNDGPFKDLRPSRIGVSASDLTDYEHCLYRTLIDGDHPDAVLLGMNYNSTAVELVLRKKNFATFHTSLEGYPHAAVHISLGGEQGPNTSPNDPLFFLHHAMVDRLWWLWQQRDLANRSLDYSGRVYNKNGSYTPDVAKLDDALQMLGIQEDLTVRDVMNTTNSHFCYTY